MLRETEEPVIEVEKNVGSEKPLVDEEGADASKDNPVNEPEEKEPEDKVNLSFGLGYSLWINSPLLGCTFYYVAQ